MTKRADPREAIERLCGELRRLAADGYVVQSYAVHYDRERPHKASPKVELGIRIDVHLSPI